MQRDPFIQCLAYTATCFDWVQSYSGIAQQIYGALRHSPSRVEPQVAMRPPKPLAGWPDPLQINSTPAGCFTGCPETRADRLLAVIFLNKGISLLSGSAKPVIS